MQIVNRLADNVLARLVPQTSASATDNPPCANYLTYTTCTSQINLCGSYLVKRKMFRCLNGSVFGGPVMGCCV